MATRFGNNIGGHASQKVDGRVGLGCSARTVRGRGLSGIGGGLDHITPCGKTGSWFGGKQRFAGVHVLNNIVLGCTAIQRHYLLKMQVSGCDAFDQVISQECL